MATYAEIYDLRSNSDFRNKVAVAAAVKAHALLSLASPSAAQVTWATATLANPISKADSLINYVLAANKSATTGQILAATDTAIQTNVDAAVDKIIAGGG